MNIALEQTREIVQNKVRKEYGDAFIRGNNGVSLGANDEGMHNTDYR